MDNETAVAIMGGLLCIGDEQKRKRRIWSKNWLQKRQKFSHMSLLRELAANEPQDFRNYLRMTESCFLEILELVRPKISKEDTMMRDAVPSEERLIATLQFLATGRSYENLKFSCAISPQLLGRIIPETCEAIFEALGEQYLKFPTTPAEWHKISDDFRRLWQAEHVLGAMDGKHIAINKPANSGSLFYNYKGFHSVVLFGIANANYELVYVHCGANGRISDGGVLQATEFGTMLESGELNLPEPASLHMNPDQKLPYVFIGDEAFPLKENLMKPYPSKNITRPQKVFNYRICRARRIIENVFGILAARFCVLQTTMRVDVETVDKIVLACCVLHNYLRKKSLNYITTNSVDSEDIWAGTLNQGDWREQATELVGLHRLPRPRSAAADEVRKQFTNYYNNEGAVSFQERMIV